MLHYYYDAVRQGEARPVRAALEHLMPSIEMVATVADISRMEIGTGIRSNSKLVVNPRAALL